MSSTLLRNSGLAVAVIVSGAFVFTGCSASDLTGELTGSSSCKDFMEADVQTQSETISKLATEYNAPDLATPLGAPNVSYQCASSPDKEIGEIFQQFSQG